MEKEKINTPKIDRKNKPWNRYISDREIYSREFSIGELIQSNLDKEFFRELARKVLSTYLVMATFEYKGYNGDSIVCNNQTLVYRDSKRGPIKFGKDVEVVQSNLNTLGGGSNKYPSVAFKGAKIQLRFKSYGLPFVGDINGWSIKVHSLEIIDLYELLSE